MQETELYAPVRAFLNEAGYEVKAEVGACDVVGVAGDDLAIVELKTGFSLTLFHQAIARLALTDQVYVAVPKGKGRPWLKSLKRNMTLCRRLGLGLLSVDLTQNAVRLHLKPGTYSPRASKPKRKKLLAEFAAREGDPNVGGATRVKVVTSYRQDATRCARYLAARGEASAKEVAAETGVTRARQIMYDNHYGWFIRPEKGIYALGAPGVREFAQDE